MKTLKVLEKTPRLDVGSYTLEQLEQANVSRADAARIVARGVARWEHGPDKTAATTKAVKAPAE